MTFEKLLADRTVNMKSSAIRETLKVVGLPDMISLAGGIPAPESFPMDIFEELSARTLEKYGCSSLQYGPTDGFPPLREAMAGLIQARGIRASAEQITVSTGSQGALDSLGKLMISRGDKIAVESPTYLGAISAFNPYEPTYVSLATDDDGVIPESIEEVLKGHDIKFIYLVPNFQNPTGRTIPIERRREIARLILAYNALLIEDDPYWALRYRGEDIPPIKTLAPDNVVYLTTMSKILAPGLRLGINVAPDFIQRWMVLAKQGVDLHTSSFDQALATEYINGGYLKRQIPKIIRLYRPRREAMLHALQTYFPQGSKWSMPDGGMFIWAEGPKGLDTAKLYRTALERKVAFVPGQYFFTTPDTGKETMRLNFTNANEATLTEAIRRLAEVITEAITRHGLTQTSA
jgi:2-aminoadipate transaminase